MNCPICKKQSFYEWGRSGVFTILRCKGCGIGITSPFPTIEDLTKVNQDIYQVDQRIQTYLSKQEYFEKRYRKYINKIKLYKENGDLLDIGCNIGLFLKVAQQNGFSTTGVELNKECAHYGQQFFKLKIFSGYLEDISFRKDSFDIVTLFDVLEHIPDIIGFIAEVRRILKINGLLVLQSPNIDSVMAKLTKSKWNWLCPPDHLYHFTSETMIRFLTSNGFTIKEIKTWEPAEDFCNNLIMAYQPEGILGRLCSKVIRLINIPLYSVSIFQHLWWRKLKGGLIEVYAIKSEEVR